MEAVMPVISSEVIGFSGAAIAAYAYAPQIRHLIGERCSAGISIRAFGLWLAASVLVTVHAVTIFDPVFILLGVIQFVATGVILFFGREYRYMVCAFHRQHPEAAASSAPTGFALGRRGARKVVT
jgi:hypothetical protein